MAPEVLEERVLKTNVFGDGGANRLFGSSGADRVFAREGADTVLGREGNDLIYGEEGRDLLYGENGADTIYGGDGADSAYGMNGRDSILGGPGNDFVRGGDGDDFVSGGSGNDDVGGGNGNDMVYGGEGTSDRLTGGAGSDRFGFKAFTTTITDLGLGDTIDRSGHAFPQYLDDLQSNNPGSQFVVGGKTVVLNVPVSSLTPESFFPILPRRPAPPSVLNISDASVTEGGNLLFNVALSSPSSSNVTFTYITQNGSALAGHDYIAETATVVIPAGHTSPAPLDIQTLNDQALEHTESMSVVLTGINGAQPGDTTGTGTIADDDSAVVNVVPGSVSIVEGDSGQRSAVFNIVLTRPVAEPIQIDVMTRDGSATGHEDFVPQFASPMLGGVHGTAYTFRVPVLGDTTPESNETFQVVVSNLRAAGQSVSLGNSTGRGTILDDDPNVGSLSGKTFYDSDLDGERDVDEAALKNVTVFLDQNGNLRHDDGERSTESNAVGGYSFTELPAGQYTVVEEVPDGFRQTGPIDLIYQNTFSVDGLSSELLPHDFITPNGGSVNFEQADGVLKYTAVGGDSSAGVQFFQQSESETVRISADVTALFSEDTLPGYQDFQRVVLIAGDGTTTGTLALEKRPDDRFGISFGSQSIATGIVLPFTNGDTVHFEMVQTSDSFTALAGNDVVYSGPQLFEKLTGGELRIEHRGDPGTTVATFDNLTIEDDESRVYVVDLAGGQDITGLDFGNVLDDVVINGPATLDEGETGTWTTPDLGDGFTYEWEVSFEGTVIGTGTGVEFSAASPDDGSLDVDLTVTSPGDHQVSSELDVDVQNLAPDVTIVSGPTEIVRGQPATFEATVVDVDLDLDDAVPQWTVVNADNEVVDQGTGLSFETSIDVVGAYTVRAFSDDGDGGSDIDSVALAVATYIVEPDPENPGSNILRIGGTELNDNIRLRTVRNNPDAANLDARFGDGVRERVVFDDLSQIHVTTVGGDDIVNTARKLAIHIVALGGDGNDRLIGGAIADTLDGGEGNDRITGRDGDDAAFGGAGNDNINTGNGADFIDAGDGDDTVNAGHQDNTVLGGSGNDTVTTGNHNDSIVGGAGNDSVKSNKGDDTVYGGVGDDTIVTSSGNDIAFGEDGDDRIHTGSGNDLLEGGDGADHLTGHKGEDTIRGDEGDDQLFGGSDSDVLDGGSGHDLLKDTGGNNTLSGSDGDDTITGGGQIDVIFAGLGNDIANGGGGNDVIHGDDGNDSLRGGNGRDVINGGIGDDTLGGDGGHDTLNGNVGADSIKGGRGNDVLNGHAGNDTLIGENGHDTIHAGEGDDQLDGSGGNDLLNGDAGNDTIFGGSGNDRLAGMDGDDQLDGGSGNDWIRGDGGLDTLIGGKGKDLLAGGEGADDLDGGDQNDRLHGGSDDDVLDGGSGRRDSLDGGGGTDDLSDGDEADLDAVFSAIEFFDGALV